MRTNKDTRGKSWFDIFEAQDGQTDLSVNYPGVIRAFHLHKNKDETWVVADGEFKVVLSGPIKVFYPSQGEEVFIKRGRWHGFQVLGNELGIMIEYTTIKHMDDPEDDYRKPYNEFDSWEIEKK